MTIGVNLIKLLRCRVFAKLSRYTPWNWWTWMCYDIESYDAVASDLMFILLLVLSFFSGLNFFDFVMVDVVAVIALQLPVFSTHNVCIFHFELMNREYDTVNLAFVCQIRYYCKSLDVAIRQTGKLVHKSNAHSIHTWAKMYQTPNDSVMWQIGTSNTLFGHFNYYFVIAACADCAIDIQLSMATTLRLSSNFNDFLTTRRKLWLFYPNKGFYKFIINFYPSQVFDTSSVRTKQVNLGRLHNKLQWFIVTWFDYITNSMR